jgi:nicotinamide riboside kinase
MKIGMTGTVSVGKTTLAKALQQLPEFKNYFIATERSKYLRDLGIPLNTDSSIKGQFMFIAERASELFNENLITDRTMWDVCAFTLNANSITHEDKMTLLKSSLLLMSEYDYVFYISPEGIEIEDNGVRETNSEYRDKIDSTIKSLLEQFPPRKLITIKGSTEDRIEQIKQTLFL